MNLANIIMLPTGTATGQPSKPGEILQRSTGRLEVAMGGVVAEGWQGNHLYLISTDPDDGVMKTDWFIAKNGLHKAYTADDPDLYNWEVEKVVASTDPALGLPLIPRTIINEFIKSYAIPQDE